MFQVILKNISAQCGNWVEYGIFSFSILHLSQFMDLWIICLHYFSTLPLLSGLINYLFALFQHITITVWTFKLFVCIISAYNPYWLDMTYLLALFQDINITLWTYELFVCIISAYNLYCLDLRSICLHYFSIQPFLLSGPMDYLFALFQDTTITVWTYELFVCIISA